MRKGKPKWRSVDSSAIKRIAYDSSRHELYVEFHHSGIYTFEKVRGDTFYRLLKASSVGQYFNRVVKPSHEPRKGLPHDIQDLS